ncbi:MAG: DUF72 domain-containing protein [Acidobacteriota bacterium]
MFKNALDAFLASLQRGWKYAIEIRNDNYLVDDYLRVLRAHNVAHVFNSWTRMPPLDIQVMRDDLWTADFAVCRALLRPGLAYETSLDAFEPFGGNGQHRDASFRQGAVVSEICTA